MGEIRNRGVAGGCSWTQIGSVWPGCLAGSITISQESTKNWKRLVGGGRGQFATGSLVPGAPSRGGEGGGLQALESAVGQPTPAHPLRRGDPRTFQWSLCGPGRGSRYPTRGPQSRTSTSFQHQELPIYSPQNYPPNWQLSAGNDAGGCGWLCSAKPQPPSPRW